MTQELWSDIENYYDNLMLESDPDFSQIIKNSLKADLPSINVTPCQGKLLNLLARFQQATQILEIGTLGGYSTAWLAQALAPTGKLISLELDPKYAEVATNNLSNFEFANLIDIRVGNALETLKTAYEDQQGPFDLIFLDADKTQYSEYLDWAIKLSRSGTMIIADNVVRDGEIIDTNSPDPRVHGIREFNIKVSSNPQLSTTVIQTVGSKGYDGFAFIRVN